MRRGYTLFELCAVLLLASLSAAVVFPAAGRVRDALAVVAAREAVAGLIAEARTAALAHGGAEVHLAAAPWRAWAVAGRDTLRVLPLEADFGVEVRLTRKRRTTTLRYDALGLGQIASETLGFSRGGQERLLIISGYGRVRRP